MKIELQVPCFHWPGSPQNIGPVLLDIARTVLGSIKLAPDAMSVDEVVEVCHELAEIGFQHVIYNMPNTHEIKPVEVLAQEIIPRVTAF
jgi:hypothetical protein